MSEIRKVPRRIKNYINEKGCYFSEDLTDNLSLKFFTRYLPLWKLLLENDSVFQETGRVSTLDT